VRCLVESKKVVIVGIPGAGKTSIISKIVEILNSKSKTVSVNSFGTAMFEEAKKNGIKDRDELRKLPLDEQQKLQKTAAEKISQLNDDVVIIDTHAFIVTNEGFYPGLPDHVLKILHPSNFISVSAKPEEIYYRRIRDDTRNRDIDSIASIKKELSIHESMISTCSVLSGSPIKPILNRKGKIEEAANDIISIIGM